MDYRLIWLYCLSDLLNVMLVLLYIRAQFSKAKTGKIWVFIWLVAYFLAVVVCHLGVKIPMVTMAVNLVFVFALTNLYESPMQRRLLSTLFTYVFLMLCEGAGIALSILLQGVLPKFQQGVVNHLFVKLLAIFLLNIYLRRRALQSLKRVRFGTSLKLILVPLLSYGVISLFTFRLEESPAVSMTIITTLIAVNIIVFMLYDELALFYAEQTKLITIKEKMRFYDHQMAEIVHHQDLLRMQQHDMRNSLLTLKAYIESGETDAAVKHIEKLGAVEVDAGEFARTGILVVDSMVNYKLGKAKKMGAQVAFNAIVPTDIGVAAEDIAAILGNMLDNALEAIANVPQKERELKLGLEYNTGNLVIKMQNSYKGARSKSNGRFVSTKRDDLRHGYGLVSIETILEKYDGLLQCGNDERLFLTKVVMFERKMSAPENSAGER